MANACDECGDADGQDNDERFPHAESQLGEVAAGIWGDAAAATSDRAVRAATCLGELASSARQASLIGSLPTSSNETAG